MAIDGKTTIINAGGNAPLVPSNGPAKRDDVSEARAFFGSSSSAPTLSDFSALVGVSPAVVRVKGYGQRGLRWTVRAIKGDRVEIVAKNDAGQERVETHLVGNLTIAPCSDSRRKGAM